MLFRSFLAALSTVLLGLAAGPARAQNNPDRAKVHTFVLPNFRTESGAMLPQARVVYGTYGRLNAARDNAILLPSHYLADHRGYEWLIGPGKALDTTKVFLVPPSCLVTATRHRPATRPSPFTAPASPS